MAQPFSYMLNVPDPAAAVTGGLQQGIQLGTMMERADLMAAQRRQTDIENRGLLAKQARVTEFQNELGKLSSEGFSARGLNELMIKYPEASEQLKAQYANLSTQEKQSRVDTLAPIVAAVNAGDNASAQIEIQRQIDAFKNSGKTQEADAAQRMSELLFQNPAAARTIMNTSIAAAMGPDKYAEVFGKLEDQRREQEVQPFKVQEQAGKAREQAGKAEKAEVEGRYAERTVKSEIKKSEAAAQASLASASRAYEEAKTEKEARSAKIEGMVAQAALNRAQAQRQLAEAKTEDDMREARIALTRATADAKAASAKMSNFKPATKAFEAASTAAGTTADTISTINKLESLINKPSGAFGTVLDRMTGPAASRAPSVFSESRDVDALLSQLTAQAFLDKIPVMRGTGPLSDAEGKKLSAAAGNLTLNQSPAQFRATLAAMKEHAQKIQDEAQKTITKYNQDYGEAPTPAAPAGGGGGVAGMSDDELKKLLGL